MNLSDFILALLSSIYFILKQSCQKFESSDDLDPEGIPFSKEWEVQTFMLASIRDCIASIQTAKKESSNE